MFVDALQAQSVPMERQSTVAEVNVKLHGHLVLVPVRQEKKNTVFVTIGSCASLMKLGVA